MRFPSTCDPVGDGKFSNFGRIHCKPCDYTMIFHLKSLETFP